MRNTLAKGDNLKFMEELMGQGYAGSFSFIYIDPPFLSGANYMARVRGEKNEEGNAKSVKAYGDWGSMDEYLERLRKRLILMRELLSEDGNICVHLDWHAVHYVKVLMDEIFGSNNFLNEIIWSYKSGGSAKTRFSRKHDNLLLYSKNEKKHKFHPLKEKSYNRGFKPYHFKGVEEFEDEKGWYTLVNMKDVWEIDMVGRTSAERTGYETQKPLALMKRLLDALTDEGDLCGDFYSGSGSFVHAAELMGRRWMACDMGDAAMEISKKRLEAAGASFEYIEI